MIRNKTKNRLMIKSIHRRSLPGVLPSSNPFAGGVTGGLLVLCLWLMPAVLPTNAASGGTVVAWGQNYNGQTNVPAGLSGVTAIAAGGWHTVALRSDGTVVAWGWNTDGQTIVPAGLSGVTAIAAGAYHTVALVAPQPPQLTIIPYAANVILTWPTNAAGFALQSTTNLVSPAVWSTVSPGPIVIGGQNLVINSTSGAQKFFRLSQ